MRWVQAWAVGMVSATLVGLGGTTPARSGEPGAAAAPQFISRLNDLRRAAGLEPVVVSEELTEGCRAHVRYLITNRRDPRTHGFNSHYESPDLPGYSEQGLNAANNSVIAMDMQSVEAVEAWTASLYHRVRLLRPVLKEVGLASGGGFVVMDVESGVSEQGDKPVAFPGNGQTNVPLHFQDEMPDPIPAGASPNAGYPITMQFPMDGPEAAKVNAVLTDAAGKAVPSHLSSPEAPATDFPQFNTVCLIPKRTLQPGVRYTATISAVVGDESHRRTWSFTTKAGPALARR